MERGGTMRGRAAVAALLLLAALSPGAGAAPSTSMTGATVLAVDDGANGLYERLNVTLHMDVAQAGAYQVNGTLLWPPGNTRVASALASGSLPAGASFFTISFEGPAISEKGLDGPYEVRVELRSSPAGGLSENASFATAAFRAAEFEPPAPSARPRAKVGAEAVEVFASALNATVALGRPRIEWGVGPVRFEAAVTTAVAFADDGDGAFEAGEELCAADLTQGAFGLAALEIGPTAQSGWAVAVRVAGPLQFSGAACGAGVAGNATFGVEVRERNGTAGAAAPMPVLGGAEVALEAALTLDAGLPGSGVAFVVALQDLTARTTSYLLRGPAGYAAVSASGADTPPQPVAAPSPAQVERASFANATGAVVGYFGWGAVGSLALEDGSSRFGRVQASYALLNGTLRLYLALPATPSVKGLAVGGLAGAPQHAAAPPLGTPPPPPPAPPPSALVFAAALAAASAMFFFSVYARARKF